jgi:hypothetical protein
MVSFGDWFALEETAQIDWHRRCRRPAFLWPGDRTKRHTSDLFPSKRDPSAMAGTSHKRWVLKASRREVRSKKKKTRRSALFFMLLWQAPSSTSSTSDGMGVLVQSDSASMVDKESAECGMREAWFRGSEPDQNCVVR